MADTLLKDAIADAKAVRATALANAKLALQEAFTPKLQSMLSAKLKNEMEGDFDKEGEEEVPIGLDDTQKEIDPTVEKEETDVTASSGVDPEKEMAGDVGAESGSNTVKSTEDTLGKTTIEEEGEDELPVDGEEELPVGSEEDSVTSEAEEIPVAGEEDQIPDDEDNVELEAIIKELEAEDEVPVEEPALGGEEVPAEEVPTEELPTEEATDVTADAGQDTEKEAGSDVGVDSGSDTIAVAPGEEELDLESLVKEIENEMGNDESEEEKEKAGMVAFEHLQKENITLKKSLKEHRDVIMFMRGKLNETNLLNAKLLYTNKLFRSNTLSESQKVRVLEALDRANSIREAKLVYSTLAEALKVRKPLTEGKKKDKGSASKSTGSTKPSTKILSEGTDIRARFQRLAGVKSIKKFI